MIHKVPNSQDQSKEVFKTLIVSDARNCLIQCVKIALQALALIIELTLEEQTINPFLKLWLVNEFDQELFDL
jgi:hypothetical protein